MKPHGDVIVAANGHATHRLADLTDQMEQIGVGQMLDLLVKRDGKTRSFKVQIDVSQQSS
jgi:S1-C subfamily serine protease